MVSQTDALANLAAAAVALNSNDDNSPSQQEVTNKSMKRAEDLQDDSVTTTSTHSVSAIAKVLAATIPVVAGINETSVSPLATPPTYYRYPPPQPHHMPPAVVLPAHYPPPPPGRYLYPQHHHAMPPPPFQRHHPHSYTHHRVSPVPPPNMPVHHHHKSEDTNVTHKHEAVPTNGVEAGNLTTNLAIEDTARDDVETPKQAEFDAIKNAVTDSDRQASISEGGERQAGEISLTSPAKSAAPALPAYHQPQAYHGHPHHAPHPHPYHYGPVRPGLPLGFHNSYPGHPPRYATFPPGTHHVHPSAHPVMVPHPHYPPQKVVGGAPLPSFYHRSHSAPGSYLEYPNHHPNHPASLQHVAPYSQALDSSQNSMQGQLHQYHSNSTALSEHSSVSSHDVRSVTEINSRSSPSIIPSLRPRLVTEKEVNPAVEEGPQSSLIMADDNQSLANNSDVSSSTSSTSLQATSPMESDESSTEETQLLQASPEYKRRASTGKWTAKEDASLMRAVNANSGKSWKKVALLLPGRTDVQCLHRWQKVLKPGLVKGPWTPEEDTMVIELVQKHGQKKWSFIARQLHGRLGKQCRERWYNHLNPDIKKGHWTSDEDKLIIENHARLGNRWAEISKCLDGRTDNAIKNRWNSSLKRSVEKKAGAGDFVQDDGASGKVGCGKNKTKGGRKRKLSSAASRKQPAKRTNSSSMRVDSSDNDAAAALSALAFSVMPASTSTDSSGASSLSPPPMLATTGFVSPSPKSIYSYETLDVSNGVESIPQLHLSSEDKINKDQRPVVHHSHHPSLMRSDNGGKESQEQQQEFTTNGHASVLRTSSSFQRMASLSDANLLMDLNRSSPTLATTSGLHA